MLNIEFHPLLDGNLIPLTPQRLQALPDIIDIHCGCLNIALYFYPIASWHFGFGCLEDACTIVLPTMLVECSVF